MSPTTSTSSRDIEQLIYDIAEMPKDEDYQQLYQQLAQAELFIPIDEDSLDNTPSAIHLGDTIHTDDAAQLSMCSIEGPRGDSFVPVATIATSPMVADGYVEVGWLEALEIVLKMDGVEGILLQGTNSWICFYKPQMEQILQRYGS